MKAALFAATAALLLFAGTARADLVAGDTMNVQLNHTGPAGGLGFISGVHTYGQTDLYSTMFFGSLDVTSPDPLAPTGNSMVLDFTDYAADYGGFTTQTATLTLTGIAEDVLVGSGQVLIGGASMGSVTEIGDSLIATWAVDDVLALAGTKQLTVVWNSVPAPGAAALLGLAGMMTRRGRRRN